MPDETVETTTTGETKPEPAATVRDVAETFAKVLAEQRSAVAPTVVAPAAPAPTPYDSTADRAAMLEEYQTLCTGGRHADAAVYLQRRSSEIASREAATRATGNPADHPAVSGLIERERRSAKSTNKDLFERFGAEIEAEIAKMPVEERVHPRAWDRAIQAVRASHFDDLVREASENAVKAAMSSGGAGSPATGAGTRGRTATRDADANDVDDETIAYGVALGYTPEQYAKLAVETEKARVVGRRGIPLRSVEVLPSVVEPGRF